MAHREGERGQLVGDMPWDLIAMPGAESSATVIVVPVMNGHPRDQAKVSVHCRWPLIRGNLTLKCVGRGIDNVAVQGRWPLTTGSPKAGTTVSASDTAYVFWWRLSRRRTPSSMLVQRVMPFPRSLSRLRIAAP